MISVPVRNIRSSKAVPELDAVDPRQRNVDTRSGQQAVAKHHPAVGDDEMRCPPIQERPHRQPPDDHQPDGHDDQQHDIASRWIPVGLIDEPSAERRERGDHQQDQHRDRSAASNADGGAAPPARQRPARSRGNPRATPSHRSDDGPQMGDVAGRYGAQIGIARVDAQPALFVDRDGVADDVCGHRAAGPAPGSRWSRCARDSRPIRAGIGAARIRASADARRQFAKQVAHQSCFGAASRPSAKRRGSGSGDLVGLQRHVESDADHDHRLGAATSARMPASLPSPTSTSLGHFSPACDTRHGRDRIHHRDTGRER